MTENELRTIKKGLKITVAATAIAIIGIFVVDLQGAPDYIRFMLPLTFCIVSIVTVGLTCVYTQDERITAAVSSLTVAALAVAGSAAMLFWNMEQAYANLNAANSSGLNADAHHWLIVARILLAGAVPAAVAACITLAQITLFIAVRRSISDRQLMPQL